MNKNNKNNPNNRNSKNIKEIKRVNQNEKNVIYYNDELNDEFSKAKIIPRKIDGRFKYNKSAFWEFWSFLIQNVLSMPIKILYLKIKFNHKYIGTEKFKKYGKEGFFIYSNHTQAFSDTFTPSVAVYPKRNFLIVNPANISLKGTGWLVELLGAIPIPEGIEAYKNFLNRIENRIEKGYSISIYPEAHIWPYYTKIRPFKAVSFKYPVKLNAPVYCITNTYQGYGRHNNKIQLVSYVDGPFYPNEELQLKERQQDLRDRVYEKMVERSRNNNVEHIKYVKIEKNEEKNKYRVNFNK